eukprot:6958387-Alexandrium_andersonii.AAC.1
MSLCPLCPHCLADEGRQVYDITLSGQGEGGRPIGGRAEAYDPSSPPGTNTLDATVHPWPLWRLWPLCPKAIHQAVDGIAGMFLPEGSGDNKDGKGQGQNSIQALA